MAKKYIIDPVESIKIVMDYKALPRQREYANKMGRLILKMVENIGKNSKWNHYCDECKDIMNYEATKAVLKYIRRWDPDKGVTPYSYMLMIINHYFSRGIRIYYSIKKKDNKIISAFKNNIDL